MRVGFLMVASALSVVLASGASAQTASERRAAQAEAPRTAARSSRSAERPPVALAIGQTIGGELSLRDNQRRSGKFEDVYTIQGRAGQRVEIRLESTDFDAFLLITGPGGLQVSNDDESGQSLNSRLIVELPADGTYRVAATSYSAGSMGEYRISARPASAGAVVTTALPARPIEVGANIQGRLTRTSARLGEKFQDRYRFTGRRGERVRIEVASEAFDTVVSLEGPDGSTQANDDTTENGRTITNSRLDAALAEDGAYTITVTSFAPNATGAYSLRIVPTEGDARTAAIQGGQRVLVVAAGVSDYERMSDLNNTDDDATELLGALRQAGVLHPASVALTNREATFANVSAALRRAAQTAGPNDLVIFFFSGHGDQVDVQRSAAELDGRAETIELFDRAMRDTELQALTDRINARMVMVAIDACFSGGFRNVVNRPNVFGLFSSEEDLTSLVAGPLEAGGYLSYFLRTGLAGEADGDGDGVVTAGELGIYLRRNFRRQGDLAATTREDEPDYQNLVLERGGIHVNDGILRLRGTGSARTAAAAVPPLASGPAVAAAPQPEEEPEGDKPIADERPVRPVPPPRIVQMPRDDRRGNEAQPLDGPSPR